jgi:hypothetical protein
MAIKVGSCTVIDDTRNLANVCSISLVSGNQGTSGQVLQSQGTGQPSTWATVSSISNYAYDSRNDLRSTTPNDGAHAFVQDLGYFTFILASDEPDDDETSFRNATGAWLLTAPTWNTIEAFNEFEPNGGNYSLEVVNQIAGVSQNSYAYQCVQLPGANQNDVVEIYPICGGDYAGTAYMKYTSPFWCIQAWGGPCVYVSVSCGYVYSSGLCGYCYGNVCKWKIHVQKV